MATSTTSLDLVDVMSCARTRTSLSTHLDADGACTKSAASRSRSHAYTRRAPTRALDARQDDVAHGAPVAARLQLLLGRCGRLGWLALRATRRAPRAAPGAGSGGGTHASALSAADLSLGWWRLASGRRARTARRGRLLPPLGVVRPGARWRVEGGGGPLLLLLSGGQRATRRAASCNAREVCEAGRGDGARASEQRGGWER